MSKTKIDGVDNFNKKLAGYLKKEYVASTSKQTHIFANNLYKTKHDIAKKFRDGLESYVILSDMFKASFLSGDKTPESLRDGGINPNYDRKVLGLIDFHVSENKKMLHSDKETVKGTFIENHRSITKKVFDSEMLQSVLASLFQYNQPLVKITTDPRHYKKNDIGMEDIYYYSGIAKLLVQRGTEELVKHLHPEKERHLIDQLLYMQEMVNRLDVPDLRPLDEYQNQK